MSISNSDYSKMTDKASPHSPKLLNSVKAFVSGVTGNFVINTYSGQYCGDYDYR